MNDAVMPELKRATQTLHDATEQGSFNKQLVIGRLPREAFVDLLGQFQRLDPKNHQR